MKVPSLRWWIASLRFLASILNYIDRQILSILAFRHGLGQSQRPRPGTRNPREGESAPRIGGERLPRNPVAMRSFAGTPMR